MTSKIVVNNIEADSGINTITFISEVTAPTFNGNIVGTAATFSGNVDIAGALTYEDVTNVDSVGIITARDDIKLTAAEGKIEATGATGLTLNASGGSAFARVRVAGDDALHIKSNRNVGIGTDNPGQKLQVQDGHIDVTDGTAHSYSFSYGKFTAQRSSSQSTFEVFQGGYGATITSKIYADGKAYFLNNVGIGTDIPNEELHIHASGTSYIRFTDEASGTGSSDGAIFGLDHPHLYAWNYEAGDFVVATNAAEKLRVTSGGNVNINGTPPWTVTGGNYRNLSISGEGASASGFLWLGNGAATSNADFDLGRVNFVNGTNIVAQITGTTQTSANDDGRISFFTKSTGSNLTERLRVRSDGHVASGGSLVASANYGDVEYFYNNKEGCGLYRNNAYANCGAHIEVGTDATDGWASVYLNRYWSSGEDERMIDFRISNTTVGNITSTTSGTTYNTTSDIRLKTDINPISDATDKLMNMNPVTHKWKEDPDGDTVHGFIAQEMQNIAPEAVHGEPDGEMMMGMDYGRITPIIVAALQNAIKEINTLKKRISELEN